MGTSLDAAGSTRPGFLARVLGSAVLWSWMFSALRLASGLVLLPLLSRVLSPTDFGMHYVFLNLATVIPMMDFGFGLSVERGLAYARGGAQSLEAIGLGAPATSGEPNRRLLSDVLTSSLRLYRRLTLGGFLVLGGIGTVLVGSGVSETSSASVTWTAWAVHLVALSLELYTGFWVTALRGMGRVRSGARWLALAYGLRLLLGIGLLLSGLGLLALPIAGLVSGILIRAGAGREVRREAESGGFALGGATKGGVVSMLRVLWPNAWRLGVQVLAIAVTANAFTYLCRREFGLAAVGVYGLSVQVMNIAVGIASVWSTVKWPTVAKLRQEGDLAGIWRLIRPRYFLQLGTCAGLACGAAFLGPGLLHWVSSDKQMLATPWLLVLALNALGESNFAFWTTLISTENRIPAVWAFVASQAASVLLAAFLVTAAGRGPEAFAIAPLVFGAAFNYWWWGRAGARMLGSTFRRFIAQSTPTAHGSTPTQPARV